MLNFLLEHFIRSFQSSVYLFYITAIIAFAWRYFTASLSCYIILIRYSPI